MAHPYAWSFMAKAQKPTAQTKETPQTATQPKPDQPPLITDYASL